MLGTFDCPHCGAKYPIKPVLVGRAVRCTTCKHPFSLRADGIADKVQEAAPQPVAAAAQPAAATASPQPAAQTAASRHPGTSRLTAPKTARFQKELEDQRKAMAASLSSAASAALASESVKREAASAEKKKGVAAKKGQGQVGNIGPAVLTDYGAREAKNTRAWVLGALAVVAGIAAMFYLAGVTGPEKQALRKFTAAVEGDGARYGERISVIQQRGWVLGVAPLTELGRVRLGAARSCNLSPAKDTIVSALKLKNSELIEARQVWAEASRVGDVERAWVERKDRAANLAKLNELKIPFVDHTELVKQLTAAGLTEADVAVLVQLMTGRTGRAGEHAWGEKLGAGQVPDRLEIREFGGTRGQLLIDLGRSYKQREVDYSGVLLRTVGAGWPEEWKVLSVSTTARD